MPPSSRHDHGLSWALDALHGLPFCFPVGACNFLHHSRIDKSFGYNVSLESQITHTRARTHACEHAHNASAGVSIQVKNKTHRRYEARLVWDLERNSIAGIKISQRTQTIQQPHRTLLVDLHLANKSSLEVFNIGCRIICHIISWHIMARYGMSCIISYHGMAWHGKACHV